MIRIFGNSFNKDDIFIKIPTFRPYCDLSLAKLDFLISLDNIWSHHEHDAGGEPDVGHRVPALQGLVHVSAVLHWADWAAKQDWNLKRLVTTCFSS